MKSNGSETGNSEWLHIENASLLKNWVSNLPIKSSEAVIVTDKSWSKSAIHDWQFVSANLLGLKEDSFSFFYFPAQVVGYRS